MLFNRDTILTDLREYVMEVTFNKQNGEQRVMRCTLRPDLLPETYINEVAEEKGYHRSNPDVIAAWDVQKGGWRSFRIDSVQYVQDVNENY
jgi:hypothetical protein